MTDQNRTLCAAGPDEKKSPSEMRRDLQVGGLLTLATAPGLLIMGVVLGLLSDFAIFGIMFGVSTLVAFIGVGLYLSSWFYAEA